MFLLLYRESYDYTIITASNNTYQFTSRCTIFCNCHCRMTSFFVLKLKLHRVCGRHNIRITAYKTRLVIFYTAYHCSLFFNSLRTVNKRNAAFFSKSNSIVSFDTACIIAEVIGMLREILGSSPFANFTSGVLRETFAGIHLSEE